MAKKKTTIGRYEIRSELGRGGMATVYRAFDPQFKREVAIKILPREFLHDPNFHVRFAREAQTVAALDHPAIVPVYDFGDEEGQPYIVMRFMGGGSLAGLIPKGPLTLVETAAIISRLAPGLDEAHMRGVVHRDIKPANILFDLRGDPFISDFGIVSLSESTTQLTGSGIVGTPAYMAPEMMNVGAVTPSFDIYSLGVTVFQMLTSKLPFEAQTPVGLLGAHVSKPIPDIRESRPDLPPEIQTVINRALAKDPLERYQTARALAEDLRMVAETGRALPEVPAGEAALTMKMAASPAGPETVVAPPHPGRRARGGLLVLLALVVVLIVIGAVLSSNHESPIYLAVFPPTATPTITPTATITPTPTVTSTPTITPSPTITPTPTPAPVAAVNAANLAQTAVLGDHVGTVTALGWSPDGARFLSASEDGSIMIWDAATRQRVMVLEGQTGPITSAVWSPDGTRIASASRDETVVIYDASSGTAVTTLEGHTLGAFALAWSPDMTRLVAGTGTSQTIIWDVATGQRERTLSWSQTIMAQQFSPGGDQVISVLYDIYGRFGAVVVWEADTGFSQHRLESTTTEHQPLAGAYSPDGLRVAGGLSNFTVLIWDAESGARLVTMEGHTGPVVSLAWSPDGSLIASGSEDGRVIVWDSASGERLATLRGHNGAVTALAWSPDGTTLISGSVDTEIVVWQVAP